MNTADKCIVFNENNNLQTLQEMFVEVQKSLPTNVENSIYYPKIKHLLFGEILEFCKEKVELKNDLMLLRDKVGEAMSEEQIRVMLNGLKSKYNGIYNNIGIDYHLETTRVDFAVPVFCIIKRDFIYMKKFVFRFKKKDITSGLGDLSNSGVLKTNISNKLTQSKGDGNEV